MPHTPGYLWVELTHLHYIDGNGAERSQEGNETGATGHTAGYIWIEVNNIHYIDSSGAERYLPYDSIGGSHTAGYFWVDDTHDGGKWIHYISNDTGNPELYWHQDTAHSNVPHVNNPYSETVHSDADHVNNPYSETVHSDADHVNNPYSDTTHSDDPHINVPHVNNPHADTLHSNIIHDDTAFSNVAHINTPAHNDEGAGHSDYPFCFLAGTKISMANSSSKKVEDIEISDRVLSFYNKNKLTSASVSKLFSHLVDHYYLLKTENHEVNVTGEHPFYIGEGFKRIKEFSIGDKIYILENGKLVPEKIVHKELIKKQVKIYNFKVEESQTYFANGFAVHNKPSDHGDWDDHSDIAHGNAAGTGPHSDVTHINTPHSNTTYGDVAHSNVPHINTPHSNTVHSNVAHKNAPELI